MSVASAPWADGPWLLLCVWSRPTVATATPRLLASNAKQGQSKRDINYINGCTSGCYNHCATRIPTYFGAHE